MEGFNPAMTSLVSGTQNGTTTTAHMDSSSERPRTSFTIYIVSQYLWLCGLPLILLLGIFGNVMTIVIMRRIKSEESSIDMYFMAIAVVDIIVLCTNYTLDKWTLYQFGFGLYAGNDVVCKIRTWLYTGGGTISCWCLVCMTVHRALSVVWPHRVNSLCTRRTVLLVLAGITVFFALLYSHYIFGVERVYLSSLSTYWCSLRGDNDDYTYFFENVFIFMELAVYCLLPFIVLLVSNIVLVWKLFMSVKVAGKHLTQGDSDQVQGHRKAANSVTVTVITVSVAFVVLTLPTSIDFIQFFFTRQQDRVTEYERAMAAFVQAVTILMSDTNHAVNFYLYCLTGRRFREEFTRVMCCGRKRRQHDTHH